MKDFIAFNLFIKSFKIVKVLIILRERERERLLRPIIKSQVK